MHSSVRANGGVRLSFKSILQLENRYKIILQLTI